MILAARNMSWKFQDTLQGILNCILAIPLSDVRPSVWDTEIIDFCLQHNFAQSGSCLSACFKVLERFLILIAIITIIVIGQYFVKSMVYS